MTTASERLAVVAQLFGLVAALIGLYLLVGLAWTLLAGGGAVVLLGALFEASQLRTKTRTSIRSVGE